MFLSSVNDIVNRGFEVRADKVRIQGGLGIQGLSKNSLFCCRHECDSLSVSLLVSLLSHSLCLFSLSLPVSLLSLTLSVSLCVSLLSHSPCLFLSLSVSLLSHSPCLSLLSLALPLSLCFSSLSHSPCLSPCLSSPLTLSVSLSLCLSLSLFSLSLLLSLSSLSPLPLSLFLFSLSLSLSFSLSLLVPCTLISFSLCFFSLESCLLHIFCSLWLFLSLSHFYSFCSFSLIFFLFYSFSLFVSHTCSSLLLSLLSLFCVLFLPLSLSISHTHTHNYTPGSIPSGHTRTKRSGFRNSRFSCSCLCRVPITRSRYRALTVFTHKAIPSTLFCPI